MTFLLNLLRIRRVEFRIAELPIFIMPVLLSLHSPGPVKTLAFWEGITLLLFLFAFGDIINCLADRDLDATYKPHLSRAVYGLGVRFVALQVALSALAALALAVHIAWQLDRWILPPLVILGLILGAAYSVPPVQLKGRGLAQIPCLWTIIFVGPMIFAALLINSTLSPLVLAFALAYATLQMGVILVNTAEDYPEDKMAGIRTSIIALGLRGGIKTAFLMALVGSIAVVGTLILLFAQRLLPSLSWSVLLLPIVSCIYVCYDIGKLSRSVASVDTEQGVVLVKSAAKRVPVWITLGAWTSCLATFALYLSTVNLPN
ncbi:1,4-dihydroxy-2-naphthoate octaprenyltransferase [Abditibacteriota bacterium]|nr:1,4-dihydroxy-2-naphthoate octaprenyltransferase [Abditibacteriota bacterium]